MNLYTIIIKEINKINPINNNDTQSIIIINYIIIN